MNAPARADLWVPASLELGEGPRWVDGHLVFVDILSGTLLTADGHRPGPARTLASTSPLSLGAVAPVASSPGEWVAAVGTGIALLTEDSQLSWLGRPAAGGVPRRMNDGVCDPRGRFWATCMAWDATPGGGSVFRVDHDGTITTVIDQLTVPNGPAFTADGSTMYLADSARGLVIRHDVDHAGQLGPAREFVRISDGQPDGMTVDRDGFLWVAIWGAGEVRRYGPDGSLRHAVTVPAQQPTAPCLGGHDGRRLFVTTATYGLTGDQVGLSGGVFALDVETPGTPAAGFSYTRRSASLTEP